MLHPSYEKGRIEPWHDKLFLSQPLYNEWLKSQVETEEYSRKSEVVNDLIRKARAEQQQIELIRAKLIKAEQSGFTDKSQAEILAGIKEKARQNGEL